MKPGCPHITRHSLLLAPHTLQSDCCYLLDPNIPEKKLPRFFSFSGGGAAFAPPAADDGFDAAVGIAAAAADDDDDDDDTADGCCRLDCNLIADAECAAA